MFIYKITNLLTQEVYIGQTINMEHRMRGHYASDNFRDYVTKYGRTILDVKILKEVPDEQANKVECIETLKCRLNGEKVLNSGYGTYSSKAINKCLQRYPDLNAEQLYEKLCEKHPKMRTIDMSQPYYVFKIFNDDGEIYFGKNAENKKDKINIKKTLELFKNKNVEIKIIKKCTYEEAFELCFTLCVKAYLNNEKLVNIYFGKTRGDVIKNIHKYSPHLDYEGILRELSFSKEGIYRICELHNTNNDKYYICSTTDLLYNNILGRWRSTHPVKQDLEKYHYNGFEIKELCICKDRKDAIKQSELITEQYIKNEYDLYNIRKGGKMIKQKTYIISRLENTNTNEVIYHYTNDKKFASIEKEFTHYPEFINEYKLNGMQNLKLDIYKNQTLNDYSKMIIHSVLHENNKNDIDVLRLEIIKHLCDKPVNEIVPFIREDLSDKQLKQNAKQICGNTRYRFIHVFINEQTKQVQISVNADRLQNVIQSCLFCDKSLLIAKTINYGEFEKMNIEACREAIKLMWQGYELQTENIGRVKMSWFRKFKANLGHESLERALEIYNMYLTQEKLLFWFQYHDDIHISYSKKTMFGYVYKNFLNPEKIQLHFLGYLKDFNLDDIISSFNQNVICHIKQ